MTKLQELLNNVSNKDTSYNQELFESEFNVYDTNITEFSQRMSEAWLIQWYDSDTYVGLKAYYLDNTLVATSYRSARKNKEQLLWVDSQAYTKMRNFIWEISTQSEPEFYINSLDDDTIILFQARKQSNEILDIISRSSIIHHNHGAKQ